MAKLPGRLGEIELEQRDKVGPLSIRLPLRQRLPQISEYFSRFKTNVPEIELSESVVLGLYAQSRLRPLSLSNAAGELAGNTNSGYPLFTRRGRVRGDDIAYAQNGAWRKFPAILGWRGQSSGLEEDPKQRTVWMYPQSTNIREMQLFRPLQNLMSNGSHHAAWRTIEDVDSAVENVFRASEETGEPVFSIDFSSFDQSVGPLLSSMAFDIARALFQKGNEQLFDDVEEVFHTIGMLIQPSQVLTGMHGVPSGSVFTNWIDSVVQLEVAAHCARTLDSSYEPWNQVQGDDGLLVLPGVSDVSGIADCMLEFGLEMSSDKQFIGDEDCVYLQRYYHKSQKGGMYPTYRALNSLMGQERFFDEDEWGPDMVILRSIMILENAKNSPLFTDLVTFVMNGDKYRLGAAWPGGIDSLLFESNVVSKAKSIAGFIPSYNQEDRLGGLRNFQTYKFIKENEQ